MIGYKKSRETETTFLSVIEMKIRRLDEELVELSREQIKSLASTDNKRFNSSELEEFKDYLLTDGGKHGDFVLGYSDSDEILAIAHVEKNHLGLNELYVHLVISLKSGYGSVLLKEIVNKYKNVVMQCAPYNTDTLKQYYRNQGFKEVIIDDDITKKVFGVPVSVFYSGNYSEDEIRAGYRRHAKNLKGN